MRQDLQIGEFEELVLLAVAALPDSAYGFSVRELIDKEANRSVTLATAHSALYRLEAKGMLRSHMGEATAQRGGRKKRLFTITSTGMSAIRARHAGRERLRALVPSLSLP